MSFFALSPATPSVEQCQISLAGQLVTYRLRRSQRRSLSVQIDRRGVTVAVPLRVARREIDAFLQSRAEWVVEKLSEFSADQPVPVDVVDGMTLPLLGQPCRVELLAGANRADWLEGVGGRVLRLRLRTLNDAQPVLLRAVQRYALNYFRGRLEEYAHVLARVAPGLPLPPLRLTNARTRWGSCSRRTGIRLNWRLIHLPPAQIDYVVAHEMAHLVEMNHSPRFWAVVASILPDYETAKAALREANRIIPAL